ncbi:energy transducer TonB [Aequorivita vladivostokensis]|jgi:protein TonB|uniref:Energy transducer TonB n=1 Tax=Aequorivita vladivostokensis TaxID=171194 RepID=A0ABR5DLZ1_9FLAO|nr:energy transducer TonB [Aequorivita vladivostokensis]MAB57175.1 energy transducer TonB [Aequorivita sp.]KJJ39783.1 energy transducer TonB [Aequorivita vladivostokensis]MAO47524.1 energy transducer TonB [Aequorivita sp.]MBF32213.1 energy transducer TonB [Aequorivita sp.]HAV53673.1 energy transducer TonB [Aequorivita sp.]|tara:strand:- start:98341 stop:99063 length:723 start_codon:yes stop_codon:yes gene_type:complete
MEPKKNPKADVGRRSMLFFQLGMVLMLFLAWQAIEWKSYDKSDTDFGQLDVGEELEEEIPVTQQLTPPPPPPPPPPAPEVIDVIEDEEDVEETIIESTETNQEEKIVEVKEIKEEVVEEEIADVPFAVIENVPVYPGCEGEKTNDAKKRCMSSKISEFINKKFDTNLASDLGLEGRQRIAVQFKIDKSGRVVDVRARAPHPRLEKEAMDVVQSLPNMTPGKQRGKPVGVLYSLPIVFDIQ